MGKLPLGFAGRSHIGRSRTVGGRASINDIPMSQGLDVAPGGLQTFLSVLGYPPNLANKMAKASQPSASAPKRINASFRRIQPYGPLEPPNAKLAHR